MLSLCALCLLGILLAPLFAMVFSLGWYLDEAKQPKYAMMVELLRITFPIFGLLHLCQCDIKCLSALFAAAFAPVLLSVGFIVAALFADVCFTVACCGRWLWRVYCNRYF